MVATAEKGSQADPRSKWSGRTPDADGDCKDDAEAKLRGHPNVKKRARPSCPYPIFKFHKGKVGVTHYRLEGPSDGELVIGFHGLNGMRSTWQAVAKDLISVGFQVLTYDLYGHGLSENPVFDVFSGYNYSLQFFVDQLEELLIHLKLDEARCNLLGFSLGALVALAFACKCSQKVLRLVLVAPAGTLEEKPRSVQAIVKCECFIPCAPWLVCRCCFTKKSFLRRCSPEDRASGSAEVMWERVNWNLFEKSGTIQGFLGTLTRLPIWDAEDLYRRVCQADIPVLLLWGTVDTVVPLHLAGAILDELPNSHLIAFPDCSHLLMSERAHETIATIATFLDFPPSCRLDDYQYLLPYTGDGAYRPPRYRTPPDLDQEEFFQMLGYKPKRWYKVKPRIRA